MALADSYLKSHAATNISAPLSRVVVKSRTGSASQQYQKSQVETASPTRLVIMLYEGAIRFCQIALDAMAAHDLPVQHENLLKAQRIVAELLGSLNREKGGEVADNLARLYTHMLEQLVVANLHDEPEAVKLVQSMLRDLWASWVEVERLASEGAGEEKEKRRKGEEENKFPIPNVQSSIENRQSAIGNPSRLGRVNA